MVGLGATDKVAAIRNRTLVVGWQNQVFTPFTPIGSGRADVDDPAKPHVIQRAEGLGWHFNHQRSFRQVERCHRVDRIGVGREKERVGVHQLGENDHRVVFSANAVEALANRIGRGTRKTVHEGIDTPSER
ncbi:hypothetical protein D9M73_159260 [compost metagenome]